MYGISELIQPFSAPSYTNIILERPVLQPEMGMNVYSRNKCKGWEINDISKHTYVLLL